MDSLFGTDNAIKFIVAFVVVLGLIALTAWLVRRFGSSRLTGATRGRQPRLAVIDAAAVDGRRRLVLIRRDNVEHLLMIGGPTDVVVEENIVRSSARGERGVGETTQRPLPIDNGMSPSLQPSSEPAPIAPARASRGFEDDNWSGNEPQREPVREPMREPPARIRPDSLTGMAADLSAKLHAPDLGSSFGRNPAPAETFGRPATPVEPPRAEPVVDKTDHNLAEMASRLEAALRRPPEGRPPVTDPLAVAPVSPPRPRAPEFRAPEVKAPEFKMPDAKAPDAFNPPPPPPPSFAPAKDNSDKAASKAIYDSLEQEMASLLGRPANKQ